MSGDPNIYPQYDVECSEVESVRQKQVASLLTELQYELHKRFRFAPAMIAMQTEPQNRQNSSE